MGSHEKSRETGRRRVTVALGSTASSVRTSNGQEHAEVREHRRSRLDADRTPTTLEGCPWCPGEAWRDGAFVAFAVDVVSSADHVERP